MLYYTAVNMAAQNLHGFIILLCLLMPIVSVTSLQCYHCSASMLNSKCESGIKEFAKKENSKFARNCSDYNFPMAPVCIIESKQIGGNFVFLLRECSDGENFSFDSNRPHFKKMSFHNPDKNTTICSYENNVVCLTTCNTDFCNGPQSIASINSRRPVLVTALVMAVFTMLH